MHKFAWWCLASTISLVVACTSANNKDSDVANGGDGGAGGTGGEQAVGQGGTAEGGQNASGGRGGMSTSSGGMAGAAASGGVAGGSNVGGVAGAAGKPANTGGAPAAGGKPGGVVSAACSTLTNCDTFESYPTSQRPAGSWTDFAVSGGTLAVDETRGFGGSKKSVKITVDPGGAMSAHMGHKGTGVLPATEIYMRMMVWLDAAPKGEGQFAWMTAEGNSAAQSGGKLSSSGMSSGAGASGDTWMMYGGNAAGGYQDCFAPAKTKLPLGRWTCYEFHLDGKTNSGHSWIDGRLDELVGFENAQSLTGQCLVGHNFTNGMWFVPKIEKIWFGFQMYHPLTVTATAWLDDIAVSTGRIGCPNP